MHIPSVKFLNFMVYICLSFLFQGFKAFVKGMKDHTAKVKVLQYVFCAFAVCVCVRTCMRACVRVCVCVCEPPSN